MSRLPKEIRNNLRKEAPVSLSLDPFDVFMAKHPAYKRGITCTQLMVIWPHERIDQEKGVVLK